MNVAGFLELKPAPCALFDRLDERGNRPRFMVPMAGGWRPVTWNAVADQVRHTACFLAAHGMVRGDRAVVFAANRVEWMSAALAIQAAGGVMVPVYPASTADAAAYVIGHADAKIVFLDGAGPLGKILERWDALALEQVVLLDDALDVGTVLAELRDRGVKVPSFASIEPRIARWSQVQSLGAAEDARVPGAFRRRMDAIRLEDHGLMLYTSGTSGNPKGVPLTHANVAANGRDWLECCGPLLDEGMEDLLWLPMSHIFGFGEACLGNTLGFTTWLADPVTALAKLPEVRPHVFMSVPALWEKLAIGAAQHADPAAQRTALAASTGGRLRFCLSGGAGLKREVKELLHRHGILVIEGYGLTETAPTLTLNRPDAFRFDSVGKVLPSVELELAEDGEILARGPNVFAGYHKDPEATREAFDERGWFKTGDVGRWTEDGFLQIIDRKKDILVTAGGKNIPPVNVEMRFRDDAAFAHVVVYGDAKRYLVAGVWLNEPVVAALSPDARRALVQAKVDAVNAQLASYETIKRFVIMDEPLTVEGAFLTASLKIRRKRIYEAFRERFESLYDDTALTSAAASI